jgi:hypothetical protein
MSLTTYSYAGVNRIRFKGFTAIFSTVSQALPPLRYWCTVVPNDSIIEALVFGTVINGFGKE